MDICAKTAEKLSSASCLTLSPSFLLGHTLQSGADINAKDMLKMTALHWAAQNGHQRVAETLVKHGADVHALSKFDKTPFDIAGDIQNPDLMLLLQVRP